MSWRRLSRPRELSFTLRYLPTLYFRTAKLAEQTERPTFRSQSQQALTHPMTLVAIAVLVVNDWAFKALWQNDWTTGKLSDLAWVIFASPLLAFLLSFVVGRKPLAQRGAFLVAYVGLGSIPVGGRIVR